MQQNSFEAAIDAPAQADCLSTVPDTDLHIYCDTVALFNLTAVFINSPNLYKRKL